MEDDLIIEILEGIDQDIQITRSMLDSLTGSLTGLKSQIDSLKNDRSSSTRPSGLPSPASGSGREPPTSSPIDSREAREAREEVQRSVSLLEDGARKFSEHVQDLLTASTEIGGNLLDARPVFDEIRRFITTANFDETGGALERLRELINTTEFSESVTHMRQELDEYKRLLREGADLTQQQHERINKLNTALSAYSGTEAFVEKKDEERRLERVKEEAVSPGRKTFEDFASSLLSSRETKSADIDILKSQVELARRELGNTKSGTFNADLAKAIIGTGPEGVSEVQFQLREGLQNLIDKRDTAFLSNEKVDPDLLQKISQYQTLLSSFDTLVSTSKTGLEETRLENVRQGAVAFGRGGYSDYIKGVLSDPEAKTGDLKILLEQIRSGRQELGSVDSGTFNKDLANILSGSSPEGLANIKQVFKDAMQPLIVERNTALEQGREADPEMMSELSVYEQIISTLDGVSKTVEKAGSGVSSAISGLVSGVVAALGVQQYMMTRFVQQPYQYETQPAISTIGNMGPLGELVGAGLSAEESVLQSYRSMTATGMMAGGAALGVAGSGLLGKVPGLGRLGGTGLGALGGAIGAGVGMLGYQVAGESISEMLSGDMDETAFATAISQRILNPERLIGDFLQPTMQARLSLGMEDGDVVSRLSSAAFGSEATKALGYDAATRGRIVESSLANLSPLLLENASRNAAGVNLSPGVLTDEDFGTVIDRTAQLEAFGMSKELISSVFGDISRSGSDNLDRSLGTLLMATSKDGEITNYTANVLVPALAKVVESRSIQNIARSSEQIEKETAGLFSFFQNSDTNLGKMLSANPEAMSQIFGMLDTVGESALQDPALMLYLNRMGVSFGDVLTGGADTLLKPLEMFSQGVELNSAGEVDLNSLQNISSILGFLTTTGLGVNKQNVNMAAQMMEAMRKGQPVDIEKITSTISENDPMVMVKEAIDQLTSRLTTIYDASGAQVEIVNQANRVLGLLEQNAGRIEDIQSKITAALTNNEALTEALDIGYQKILAEIERMFDIGNSSSSSSGQQEGIFSIFNPNSEKNKELVDRMLNTFSTVKSAYQDEYREHGLFANPVRPIAELISPILSSLGNSLAPLGEPLRNLAVVLIDFIASSSTQLAAVLGGIINGSVTGLLEWMKVEFEKGVNRLTSGIETIKSWVDGLTSIINFVKSSIEEQIDGIKFTVDLIKDAFVFNISSKIDSIREVLDRWSSNLGGGAGAGTSSSSGTNPLSSGPIGNIGRGGGGTNPLGFKLGFSSGGYTGAGNRIDPVGVVHGGEFVVSDNRVSQNRNTLERIQAGENFDDYISTSSAMNSQGEDITVTLSFSNVNPSQIINAAKSAAKQVMYEERVI